MSSGELVSWKDKTIESMTREELIEAIKDIGYLLHQAHYRTRTTHDLYERLRSARKRAGY